MPLVLVGEVCRVGILDGVTDLNLNDHAHYFVYVPNTADPVNARYAESRTGSGRRLVNVSRPGPEKQFRVYLCASHPDGTPDLNQQDLDLQALEHRLDDATAAAASQGLAPGLPFLYFEEGYPGITRTRAFRIQAAWVSQPREDMESVYRGLVYCSVTIQGTR